MNIDLLNPKKTNHFPISHTCTNAHSSLISFGLRQKTLVNIQSMYIWKELMGTETHSGTFPFKNNQCVNRWRRFSYLQYEANTIFLRMLLTSINIQYLCSRVYLHFSLLRFSSIQTFFFGVFQSASSGSGKGSKFYHWHGFTLCQHWFAGCINLLRCRTLFPLFF